MGSESDINLFQQLEKGDHEALKILFERYHYRLCCFAFQYVRCYDLAEEVVSDVFLNIWIKRRQLQIDYNLKAYLFKATRNQAINRQKKEKKNWDSIETIDNKPIDHCQPDEEMTYKELKYRVENLINNLPPRRRIIFKLSRIDGLKYREIAKKLSISVHTVQKQMCLAAKQIESSSIIDYK